MAERRRVVPIRGRREPWRLPPAVPGQPYVVALVATRTDPEHDPSASPPPVESDRWTLRCPDMPGFSVTDLPLLAALRAAAQVCCDQFGPVVLRVEFPPEAFPPLEAGQHEPAVEQPPRSRRRRRKRVTVVISAATREGFQEHLGSETHQQSERRAAELDAAIYAPALDP